MDLEVEDRGGAKCTAAAASFFQQVGGCWSDRRPVRRDVVPLGTHPGNLRGDLDRRQGGWTVMFGARTLGAPGDCLQVEFGFYA